jgi:hypothetical protein
MNAEEWKKAQAQLRAADNDRYCAGVRATGEALDRYARQAEEAKQVPQRTLTAVEKIVANQEKLLEIQQQTAEILQKKAGRGNKDSGITHRNHLFSLSFSLNAMHTTAPALQPIGFKSKKNSGDLIFLRQQFSPSHRRDGLHLSLRGRC